MSFITKESLQVIQYNTFLPLSKKLESKEKEPNNIYIYSCNFNMNDFTRSLFSELQVYFPDELKNSVNKRQAEFLAGRYSAKQALYHSGLWQSLQSTPTIPVGKYRCPIWPTEIIGSITHNHITAACAVKVSTPDNYIGIDIEKHFTNETSNELESTILTPIEMTILQSNNISRNTATTLAFSAKESLFKALFPRVREYFGFDSAKIESINTECKQICISLTEPFRKQHQLKSSYTCYYQFRKDSIFTLVK